MKSGLLVKETRKDIKDISQKETDRQIKATSIDLSAGQKETARQTKAGQKETARQTKASQKETARQTKAGQKETARQTKAGQKETARQTKASQKETDRQIKATSIDLSAGQKKLQASQREMSKDIQKAQNLFITQWGRLMESLVEGGLVRLLKERGL